MSVLPAKIGLVAGWGEFPVHVARTLAKQGTKVYCVGVKNHASEHLAEICHDFRMFGLGKMGAQVRYLKRAGVSQATMAGKIFKTRIFRRFHLLQHFPDLLCWKHFYPIFVTRSKDRRDDTLLTTVTELYSSGGIKFLPATNLAPELLVKEGTLTNKKISGSQFKDIQFGWQMAKAMGGLDVGQSVVVKNQAVMAVEAIEGTDECIRRAGQLCQEGGFTVVKVAKPYQDMRFDVPTIGSGTIQTIYDSGGSVLAIEAEKTIVLQQTKVIELANQLGISIVALSAADISQSEYASAG